MLTFPGHFFGAYFFVRVFSKLTGTRVTTRLLTLAILAAIVIDADVLLAPLYGMQPYQHHRFITHTPFFWAVTFLILYLFLRKYKPQYKNYVIIFAFAIFSHLILDTPEDGIAWLFPLDNNLYGLYFVSQDKPLPIWIDRYLTTPVTIAQEFLVTIAGLVVAERTRDLHFVMGDIKGRARRTVQAMASNIGIGRRFGYSMLHWIFHFVFLVLLIRFFNLDLMNSFVALVGTLIADMDHLPLVRRTGIRGYVYLRTVTEFRKPRKYPLHNILILFTSLLGSFLTFHPTYFTLGIFSLAFFLHTFLDFFEDVVIFKMSMGHWKI